VIELVVLVESFGEVSQAITDVQSSLQGLSGADLETATKKAISFGSAFDVDVSGAVQNVSTLLKSGLVGSADEAFDLLTASSQKVPAALREPILDASDEYSQFFRTIGFSGEEAFGALVAGAAKGEFGIDKTGDAIKEFTIRSTDMSSTSVDAYKAIGLNAEDMSNKILAGGDTAHGAFNQIVDGILAIPDPTTRSNTAIGLFGTQMEDLGVQDIPKFLEGLKGASGGLGEVEGAAARVDATLGGTLQSKVTAFGRTLGSIGPSLAQGLLPVIGPVLDRATESIDDLIAGVKILGTGDFSGGFFGLEEDSPVVGALISIHDAVGGVVEIVGDQFKAVWDEIWPVFEEVGGILGPALVDVFNSLKPAIMQLVPIVTQLLPLLNPFSLIFKALLPILPQIAEVVADLARVLGDALAKAVTALAPLFQTIVDVIQRLLPIVTRLVMSILPPLMGLFDKLAPLLDAVLAALLPVVDAIIAALIPAIDALMPVVELVFGFIATTIQNVMTIVGGVIDVLTGVFTGDWNKVWTGIQEIFGGVWDQIKNILSTAWEFIVQIFTNIGPTLLDIITSFEGKLIEWGSDFLTWLWEGIQAVAVEVFAWFAQFPGWVWEQITALTSVIVEYGTQFLQWIWDGITDLFPQVLQWFSDLPATAWAGVVALTSTIVGYGSSFIGWIKDGIVTGAQAIWDFVTGLPGKIGELLVKLGSKLIQLGKDLVGKIVEGVAAVAGSIWQAITDALTGGETIGPEGLPTSGPRVLGKSGGGRVGDKIPTRAGGGMMDFAAAENSYGRQWAFPNGYVAGPGGPTQDAIPTWLSDGEYVNRAASVAKYYGALEALNSDNPSAAMDFLLPHLATGGLSGTMAAAKQYGSDQAWARANELIEASKTLAPGSNGNWGPGVKGAFAANTAAAKAYIESHFSGVSSIGGLYGGSVPGSDHPMGKALDVMIANYLSSQGIAAGSRIADWFIQNPNAFGTKYVIWRDRINQGGQWAPYSHPSGNNDTLQHRDHVHLSFLTGSGQFQGGATPGGDTPTLMASLIGKAQAKLGIAGMPGGVPFNATAGTEQWRSLSLQALTAVGNYLGRPLTQYINQLLNQMRTESSGNPNAINLTDSNAKRGTPSKGLLQVIQPTFETALRGTPFANLIPRGPMDPWANIIASILYGEVTGPYHSLAKAYRGVAYANGGIVPGLPSWGTDSVPAMLTPGEGVFTQPQTNAIITHAKALEAGFAGRMPTIELHTYIDGRQFDARTEMIVDGKLVDVADAADRHELQSL